MTADKAIRFLTILRQGIFDTGKGLWFFIPLAIVPWLIVLFLNGVRLVFSSEEVSSALMVWSMPFYGDVRPPLEQGFLYSIGYALFWGIGGIGLVFRLFERLLGSWLAWLVFGVALSGISIGAITIYFGIQTLFTLIEHCLYWWFLPPLAYIATRRLGWAVGLLIGVFSLKYVWVCLAGTIFQLVPLRETAGEEAVLYSILAGMVACAYFANQALRSGAGVSPAQERVG